MGQVEPQPDPETLTLTVTRSAGDDRAVLVFIDTTFEPQGDLGLRVYLNDHEVFVGKRYDFDPDVHHEAKSVEVTVEMGEIAYTGKEVRH